MASCWCWRPASAAVSTRSARRRSRDSPREAGPSRRPSRPTPIPWRRGPPCSGARSSSLLRSRGVAVAGLGDGVALPVDPRALDLRLAGSVSEPQTAAGLEAWLRARRESFVLLAALGAPARGGDPAPATLAGAFAPAAAPHRPGRPGVRGPARRRAASARLVRAGAAAGRGRAAGARARGGPRARGSSSLSSERAAPGAATIVVGDPPPDRGPPRAPRAARRALRRHAALDAGDRDPGPGAARPRLDAPRLDARHDPDAAGARRPRRPSPASTAAA